MFIRTLVLTLALAYVGAMNASAQKLPDGELLEWGASPNPWQAELTLLEDALGVNTLDSGAGAGATTNQGIGVPDSITLTVELTAPDSTFLQVMIAEDPRGYGDNLDAGVWVWKEDGIHTITFKDWNQSFGPIEEVNYVDFFGFDIWGLPAFKLVKCWFWYGGTPHLFQDWNYPVGIEHGVPMVPSPMARLHQNYPNPMNPSTTIRFELAEPSMAELSVYDVSGRRVRELAGGFYEAGQHVTRWDGRDQNGGVLPSGVYVYRLKVGAETVLNRRLLFVK